jgi:hypothetical protein
MPELIDTTSALDLLYPLNEFYAEAGLALPSVTRINGREMPSLTGACWFTIAT